MDKQNGEYDLKEPYMLFHARLKRSIFFLQYSHSSKATLQKINNFSDGSVFQTRLHTFSEEELPSLASDYKIWTRHNIINYLIEETIILFLTYKYWLVRIKSSKLEFNSKEVREELKELLLTNTSMKKAIETLEAEGSFSLEELDKDFFITLYDMRNSLTHHQGYALKKEINISYTIQHGLIVDEDNIIFASLGHRTRLTLKESCPDSTSGEDGNVSVGISRMSICETMTINEDDFIGLTYRTTVNLMSFFSVAIKKVWTQISTEMKKYVKQ